MWNGLVDVDSLHLYRNEIETLEPAAFRSLGKLTYLTLMGNRIDHLNKGVFIGLVSLDRFVLEKNNIQI